MRLVSVENFAEQLRSCTKLRALAQGKQIHKSIIKSRLQSDRFLANLLVDMYGKCGCLADALATFQTIAKPNVYSWNIIIAACSCNLNLDLAAKYFLAMEHRDATSWTTLVSAYTHAGHLQLARQLFVAMPMRDVLSYNTMIWAFTEEDQMDAAWDMIKTMPEPDIVSWTVIIQALIDTGDIRKAREIFDGMDHRSPVTWSMLVTGHAQVGQIENAKLVFDRMPQHGLTSWNSMLAGYSQTGSIPQSQAMFDAMKERDVASWTGIMTAYARSGDLEYAEKIFSAMPWKDIVAWNALGAAYSEMEGYRICFAKMPQWNLVSLNGYLRMADPDEAKGVFDSMSRRNSISWNSLLATNLHHQRFADTKFVFDRSPRHFPVAYSSMLQALVLDSGSKTSFDRAEQLYGKIPEKEKEAFASSLMIAGYGQRGELDRSREVFDRLLDRDFVAWTAIIQAYAHSGRIDPAMNLLQQMALDGSCQPNEVTILSILNGFAHSGMAEKCREFFLSIQPDHGIHPTLDHYCCMADLLGRARRLDEAEELVATMPYLPDAVAWATLLAACRIHGDAARGARIYALVMELDPYHGASLLLASRIAADE